MVARVARALAFAFAISCAAPRLPSRLPIDPSARFTVITFFSAHCPCQTAHDARLRAMNERYHARGIAFVAVDSEASATRDRDAREAESRGYSFPLVLDDGGSVARALGAEYATYTVIVDTRGAIRYRGGIDGDRTHLTDDSPRYLEDAIDALLAGSAPPMTESKALGCALELQ